MIDVNALFRVVESQEMEFRLSAASGLEVFVEGVRSQPEVVKLVEAAESDESVEGAVRCRISSLSGQDCDPQYENPNDTALAIYLVVLREVDGEAAREHAGITLTGHNLWWARSIARDVLNRPGRTVVFTVTEFKSPVIVHCPAAEGILSEEVVLRSRKSVDSVRGYGREHVRLTNRGHGGLLEETLFEGSPPSILASANNAETHEYVQ